ncbi:MAG TPA: hypothetical protein VG245_08095 [Candidatus Dormibacteraeota bacterium]|jgi:hypothetical protein|nr:hypothetical protein [Candidatus Dormibacteraeota bacterium]
MVERRRRTLVSEDGNVTLITAFTMLLMVMVVLFTTGVGQTAADATNMQSASDQAAVTAATAFASTFNDNTFLSALEWGVHALGNLGEAISIAGDALIAAGVLSFGFCFPCDVIGPILEAVGSILAGIADAMAAVIDPFVEVVKQVLDVAKWVLGVANSTIIAGNNGYFGFMFPSIVSAAGPLLYTLQDVQGLAAAGEAITSDVPDPNFATPGASVSLKETLRRAALHTLWDDSRATDGSGPGNTPKAEPRGSNTFYIADVVNPACAAAAAAGHPWDPVGTNPFGAADPAKPPPVARDCNERRYLKQLVDKPILAEAAMLYQMKDLIDNKGRFDTSSGSQSDADAALDNAIADLRNVYDGSPPPSSPGCFFGVFCPPGTPGPAKGLVPVNYLFGTQNGAKTDQDWTNNVVNYYADHVKGQNCSQTPIHPYVYSVPTPTVHDAYETFFDCDHAAFAATVGGKPVTAYQYWDGPANAPLCTPPPPGSSGPGPDCGHRDYRLTSSYKSSDLGDAGTCKPGAGSGTDAAGNGLACTGLAKWIQVNVFPKGHRLPVPGEEAGNPLMFLEVHEIQPSFQSQLAANLSGKSDNGSRWSFALSKVKIEQSKDDKDRISFSQFCQSIFKAPPESADFVIMTLPTNATGWCVLLANAVIDIAAAIGGIPDPVGGLIRDILGAPPTVTTFHVELVGIDKVPQLCDVSNVLHSIDQFHQDPMQAVFNYAQSHFSPSGATPDTC